MTAGVSRATVDSAGRLVRGDAMLMALNTRAGGGVGLPLAIPPIAGIARLARRLGVVVSRPVTVGDAGSDLELWVRAQLAGGEVQLAVSGWGTQRPRPLPPTVEVPSEGWRWETDAALRLTFVELGEAARQGQDLAALLGRPITALFALEPGPGGELPLVDALARRTALDSQRVRLRTDSRAGVLSARVRLDAAGHFAGFSGTAMLAVEPVVQPVPLTEAFTAGLDRALRRPLARIVANADSIHAEAEGPIARDYADYAADIAGAGRHLLGLIDDLVDLQAVERSDFTLPVEPLDLADLARRAAGLLTVRAEEAGVTIVRPDAAKTLEVRGDFRRGLQILVNLIGNAIRYAPRGSAVRVTLDEVLGMGTVTVADAGKGIAPEDATRVFEKFERVDPSEPGGSGLGLYIARRLARAMGGDLTLDQQSNEGARFTLRLPLKR
jgi:signal transduction histidine kinase